MEKAKIPIAPRKIFHKKWGEQILGYKVARFCFGTCHSCSDECPKNGATPYGEFKCSLLENLMERVRDDKVDFVHCPRALLTKDSFFWVYLGTCYAHAPPTGKDKDMDRYYNDPDEDWFSW
ncbi:MAG: hypothetical protein ACKKMO_00565 [Candidatus Nealsonbacteria bacterium]